MEDKGTKLAVASIVLGGISLVCCCVWYIGCIAGIAGLAIGFIAYQNEEEGSRELPVLGIVLSAAGLALSLFMVFAVLFLLSNGNVPGGGVSPGGTGFDKGSGEALQIFTQTFL